MKSFSFRDVSLFVQGTEITGYDEGDDVILLSRVNDSASDVVGADSKMTVFLSEDLSGTVTFRLQSTSDSNAFMSSLMSNQENGLFVPIFAMFKDNRNNDLGYGSQGYIPRPASFGAGNRTQPREWIVKVERLDLLHLGEDV